MVKIDILRITRYGNSCVKNTNKIDHTSVLKELELGLLHLK